MYTTFNFWKWTISIKPKTPKASFSIPLAKKPDPKLKPKVENAQQKLLEEARRSVGKTLCTDLQYGFAESVNNIAIAALGQDIGGGPSTSEMFYFLSHDKDRFKKHDDGSALIGGEIVISPTDPKGPIGNVGIIDAEAGRIMSHNPVTGVFEYVYTYQEWSEKYKNIPIIIFDLI